MKIPKHLIERAKILRLNGFIQLAAAFAEYFDVIWHVEGLQGKDVPNTLKNGDAWLTNCDSLGHMGALRDHKKLDGMNAHMTMSLFDCGCVLLWDMAYGGQGIFCNDHENLLEGDNAHWETLMETEHAEYCQDNNMYLTKKASLINDKISKENDTFNRLTKDIELD